MVRDNRHSRLVAYARVGLPIAALALLSTLFLVSDRVDPTAASLYADVDMAELAREARIGAPQYAGVTEDGATLMVRAKAAYPDPSDNGASAQEIVAKLDTLGGLVADVTAKSGQIDPSGGPIRLGDGVALQTSTGYRMQTRTLEMATDRSTITAPGQVQGETPFGTVEAGAMELSRASAGAPYDLVFKDGVKLVYHPQE